MFEEPTAENGEGQSTSESLSEPFIDDVVVEGGAENEIEEEIFNLETPGGYEPFDPQKRLEHISKLAPDKKEPELDRFKRELEWQYFVRAQLYDRIIQRLTERPEAEPKQLWEIVKGAAKDGRFTRDQIENARRALVAYYERRNRIQQVRDSYSQDADLFQYITGAKPEGDIDIIATDVNLHIRCRNKKDYTRIYDAKFSGQEIGEKDIEQANKSGGVSITSGPHGLRGAITAENLHAKDASEETFLHEKEHSIQKLIGLYLSSAETGIYTLRLNMEGATTKEIRRRAREYLDGRLIKFYRRMKNEILAYFRGSGDDPQEIYDVLTTRQENGGLYWPKKKNIEQTRKIMQKSVAGNSEQKEKAKQIINEEVNQAFNEKLSRVIRRGINAFVQMREFGYSDEKISLILMGEDLPNWPSVAKRMT